jgi:hypothetical protein
MRHFVDAQTRSSERHTILDFTLGKDVGIGAIGAGVRIAQFSTNASADLNADPDYHLPAPFHPFGGADRAAKYGHVYDGTTQ